MARTSPADANAPPGWLAPSGSLCAQHRTSGRISIGAHPPKSDPVNRRTDGGRNPYWTVSFPTQTEKTVIFVLQGAGSADANPNGSLGVFASHTATSRDRRYLLFAHSPPACRLFSANRLKLVLRSYYTAWTASCQARRRKTGNNTRSRWLCCSQTLSPCPASPAMIPPQTPGVTLDGRPKSRRSSIKCTDPVRFSQAFCEKPVQIPGTGSMGVWGSGRVGVWERGTNGARRRKPPTAVEN